MHGSCIQMPPGCAPAAAPVAALAFVEVQHRQGPPSLAVGLVLHRFQLHLLTQALAV